MAYDPVKAHEYYEKYKKKGLKKGRKKGTKKAKKGKQTNLVGLSTGGLNDEGKMQWAMAKEKLKNEMNAAMSKAKTQEEKDKIRAEYQNKALAELSRMKSDSATAKPKKEKVAKNSSKASSKGSKSSSKGSSKSSPKSSSKESEKSSQAEMVEQIKDSIAQLQEKLSSLTDEQKGQIKETIQAQIDLIREKLKGKLTDINILSEL